MKNVTFLCTTVGLILYSRSNWYALVKSWITLNHLGYPKTKKLSTSGGDPRTEALTQDPSGGFTPRPPSFPLAPNLPLHHCSLRMILFEFLQDLYISKTKSHGQFCHENPLFLGSAVFMWHVTVEQTPHNCVYHAMQSVAWVKMAFDWSLIHVCRCYFGRLLSTVFKKLLILMSKCAQSQEFFCHYIFIVDFVKLQDSRRVIWTNWQVTVSFSCTNTKLKID